MTSQDSLRVRDCMTWDTGSAQARRCTRDCWCRGNYKLHLNGSPDYKSWFWRTPDIGKPKQHGYDLDDPSRRYQEPQTARPDWQRYSYNTGDAYGMGASPRGYCDTYRSSCHDCCKGKTWGDDICAGLTTSTYGTGCGPCNTGSYGSTNYPSYGTGGYTTDKGRCHCNCHHHGPHQVQANMTSERPQAASIREPLQSVSRPSKRDFGYGWTGTGGGYTKSTTTANTGGATSRSYSRADYASPRSGYRTSRTTTRTTQDLNTRPREIIYEKHVHHHVDGAPTTTTKTTNRTYDNTTNNNRTSNNTTSGTYEYREVQNTAPRATNERYYSKPSSNVQYTTTKTTTSSQPTTSTRTVEYSTKQPTTSGGYTSTRTYESRYK